MSEQEQFLQNVINQQSAVIKEQSATISRLVKALAGEEDDQGDDGLPQTLNRRDQ